MKKWILSLSLILVTITSCINRNSRLKALALNNQNLDYLNLTIDFKYLITEVEVDRVKVGDAYKTHKKRLKKIEDNQEESSKNNYYLLNKEKEKIAIVYLNSFDNSTIEIIEIISTKYKTEKGIGVGSTFKEAKKSYPKSETHGNELKRQTTLMAGDYHFILDDENFNSYYIDESKIYPSTTIKKIIIRK